MGIRSIINRALLPYRLAYKQEGGLCYKLKYLHFAKMAQQKGVVAFRIDRLANWYTKDWFNYDRATKEEKDFLIQKGYAPYKINRFGLSKDNYKDYLSDFELYSIKHYVSYAFVQLFEHKLNTYYLLAPFKEYLPKHYWYIDESGRILPVDCDKESEGSTADLIALLDKTPIAAKACLGGHGRGFFKLEKKGDDYYVNNDKTEKSELEILIKGLRDYIFTAYLRPNNVFRRLCGEDSYAVIRTLTVFDKEDGPQITGAMIRLGCKKAGVVSDYDGCIYTGVGLSDGKLFNPYIRETETWFPKCDKHPDTGISIDGVEVPFWEVLKNTVLNITKYISWAPYLVMDIIPTEDGFAILEINSHGEVQGIEGHYPFCKNKYNKRAFNIE